MWPKHPDGDNVQVQVEKELGLRIRSFHVVVLPRTAKKCTRMYNARAEPLFC